MEAIHQESSSRKTESQGNFEKSPTENNHTEGQNPRKSTAMQNDIKYEQRKKQALETRKIIENMMLRDPQDLDAK